MSTPDEHLEAELFGLVCMLVSSARGALEEGPFTASLRLVHAAERLGTIAAQLWPEEAANSHRTFFESVAADVRTGATTSYLSSAEEYEAFLDKAVRSMAREVRRDNGL
jgi:Family of unknown function (DUF6092)